MANHALQKDGQLPVGRPFLFRFEALSGPTAALAKVEAVLRQARRKVAPGQGGSTPGLCFQCGQLGALAKGLPLNGLQPSPRTARVGQSMASDGRRRPAGTLGPQDVF